MRYFLQEYTEPNELRGGHHIRLIPEEVQNRHMVLKVQLVCLKISYARPPQDAYPLCHTFSITFALKIPPGETGRDIEQIWGTTYLTRFRCAYGPFGGPQCQAHGHYIILLAVQMLKRAIQG